MTTDAQEVLSALMDRELVDPEQLAAVLETPEGRALLVDFVRLRAVVHGDVVERTAVAPHVPPQRVGLEPQRAWMGLAAGLLLFAGLGGGLWLGQRLTEDGPPAPSRVVQFQDGVDWR